MELNFSSGLAFCEFSKGSALKNALRLADDCMYQAKSLGRGRLFFNPDPTGQTPTC
jgi:PleD family two-component response regulator